jgi:hypothetical protein
MLRISLAAIRFPDKQLFKFHRSKGNMAKLNKFLVRKATVMRSAAERRSIERRALSSARVGRAASDTARQKMARNRLNLRNTQGDAMLRNNPGEKAEIYETISSMNRAFAGIVQHLQALNRSGLFRSKTAKLFPSFTLELQAEFNQEFLEDLHQLELDDWGRYGKARQRWEKELRDPDDVFIHAEERKKQLAKQRKRTTK